MDDRMKESLSAMLDDEADELAVRRVLAQGHNEQLQAQWLRWHRLREQIRGHDARWGDIDIRAGVWDKLRDTAEAAPGHSPLPAGAEKMQRGKGKGGPGVAALAAMFVVALVVGFGAGQQWTLDGTEAMLAGVPSVPLQNLNEDQWEQLSDYLLRHAQHNSVAAGHGAVGFARVASVSPGTP